jgi:hypothetical protein
VLQLWEQANQLQSIVGLLIKKMLPASKNFVQMCLIDVRDMPRTGLSRTACSIFANVVKLTAQKRRTMSRAIDGGFKR